MNKKTLKKLLKKELESCALKEYEKNNIKLDIYNLEKLINLYVEFYRWDGFGILVKNYLIQ